MANGFWFGDKDGGNTYQGDIADLTVDEMGRKLVFKYTTKTGGKGKGTFEGEIVGERLSGMWDETFNGVERHGLVDMKREEPVELPNKFKGRYWLTSPEPSDPDDAGIWTIEFDDV